MISSSVSTNIFRLGIKRSEFFVSDHKDPAPLILKMSVHSFYAEPNIFSSVFDATSFAKRSLKPDTNDNAI